jgi:hypothetical protein
MRTQRGSAAVESVFAVVFLAFVTVALVQVALSLYARNVVVAAAHEGARAAVEVGRDPQEGRAVALRTVSAAAGGLLDDLAIGVSHRVVAEREAFTVSVSGRIRRVGPIPFALPVAVRGTAVREEAGE